MRQGVTVLMLMVVLAALAPTVALPCSSFSLQREGVLIVGRNLDEDGHTHGMLVVNKRGVRKTGRSLQWPVSGSSDSPPRLVLDVHAELSGNVGASFAEYTDEAHRALVEMTIAGLAELAEFEPLVKSMGGTREGMTNRFFEHPGTTSCE